MVITLTEATISLSRKAYGAQELNRNEISRA